MVDDIRDNRSSRKNNDEADDEPSFSPPETVAEDDEIIDMANQELKSDNSNKPGTKAPDNKRPKIRNKFKNLFARVKSWWSGLSARKKILVAFIVILILVITGYGGYKLYRNLTYVSPPPPVQKAEEPPPPPPPTTEPSRLTGVEVPIELNKLSVTGVMIENSPDARPQSGLKEAGVVFEAKAEGGITRFLALYQEAKPASIGPVRSVRPYYLSWLQGFDAAVAHAGGSAKALAKIRDDGVKDLDQFSNSGGYKRVNNRYAPHNLYTSRDSLLDLEKSKGFNSSVFTGFLRKPEKPKTTALASSIDVKISSALYNIHYDYDAKTNSYLRSQAGKPHLDADSKQQIAPKVVIIVITTQGSDGIYATYETIGNGQAYIFQDGDVTVGTWSKASDKDQILFGDANMSPLAINPGQTWITMTGLFNNVSYLP